MLCGVLLVCAGTAAAEVRHESEVARFVELMNAHREAEGCPALEWHDGAANVAEAHSADMTARRFFDHMNPDGESPFDRLRAAGVSWRAAAENIAYGFSTGSGVLQTWLDSPGHRANIENCRYTHHGVGLVRETWTHVFLRP